ncbi:hypothetical protein AVEN_89453-1 [Araneus ventricosus]|uniref:Uncharacterized protein n=1 Tax=Araneus ventricosus TaxID=182803 RepID=A0A4Y2HNC5_ARAVE|nr:hypothetical protein AVEN_89453-1 [Araneus ventricosus]
MCRAILKLKSNAYFERGSEVGADNEQFDVAWHSQLLDSIKDVHADNEQNRCKATERTWIKCLSQFEIVKGAMNIKLCMRDSIEIIFPANKLVADGG